MDAATEIECIEKFVMSSGKKEIALELKQRQITGEGRQTRDTEEYALDVREATA